MPAPAPHPRPQRASWTIDVCIVCARHAVVPFCEHRRADGVWTMPVVVRPAYPGEFRAALGKARRMQREREVRS
jgi:hypothetical protein